MSKFSDAYHNQDQATKDAVEDLKTYAMAFPKPARGPMVHELKTWQSYFHALVDRTKTFELRKFDRDFRVGDWLWLRETHYHDGSYTGRETRRIITHLMAHEDDLGLMQGYAILSIRDVTVSDEAP